MPTNDNDSAPGAPLQPPSDPHGHAALLLVESLIHGLCENAMLSPGDAIEIAERAVSVQAEEANGAGASLRRSGELLSSIVASLRIDGDDTATPPRPVL